MAQQNNRPVLAFDDDYQIIYSSDFNIYGKKIILKDIAGYEFIFEFIKDTKAQGYPMEIHGDNENKKVKIILTNFQNSLGTGTTNRIPIMDTTEGKKIYFSIHTKSLNENTSFLKVSITFYLK